MLETFRAATGHTQRISVTPGGVTKSADVLSHAVERAGKWMLHSGIQNPGGGVARYYDAIRGENRLVSTEITGYGISTFLFLYSITSEAVYLERALLGAQFLMHHAWDKDLGLFPYEHGWKKNDPKHLAYFFDTGIITRALLAMAREIGQEEYLGFAIDAGDSLVREFSSSDRNFHPVLQLPCKTPRPAVNRWSLSAGCYQLKVALAWFELFELTGEQRYRDLYLSMLDEAMESHQTFIELKSEVDGLVDRLHPYCYFLEGLLPMAGTARCDVALADGIRKVARFVRQYDPGFTRVDVIAQLLRVRVLADWGGVEPVDREAAQWEASRLLDFQAHCTEAKINNGFYFGTKAHQLVLHASPVSTGFALQALALFDQYSNGCKPMSWRMLI
jgi:hypothetical protein